ncbi:MAG: GGDEF domain-containing protein [Acidobacteriota bacterium]|nr:GGDEF domain-containing protein [Acidobacteriota bacterium]
MSVTPTSPPVDRRRELLLEWERRCRARGGVEHTTGADALFLVTALANALRSGAETPELGRAARTWGARFSAPADAVTVLSVLRDTVIDWDRDPSGRPAVQVSVLNRLFDQMTIESVDAAAGNLRAAARHDPLTGCANRRALDEDLPRALSSAQHSRLDMAVAVVDLDGLKQINDADGHAAGDAALRGLVVALRGALREADTLYRTGGDEFVVVAPFTDGAGARAVMRRAERMGAPAFSWGVASIGDRRPAGAGTEEVTDWELSPLALLEAADADLSDRRRAVRREAIWAARRRRYTAAASVAATVGVTVGMSGLAMALDGGGAAVTPAGAPATTAPDTNWQALQHVPVPTGHHGALGRHGAVPGAVTSLSNVLGEDVPAPPTSPVPPAAGDGSTASGPSLPLIGQIAPTSPVVLVSSASPGASTPVVTAAVRVATTSTAKAPAGPGNSANAPGNGPGAAGDAGQSQAGTTHGRSPHGPSGHGRGH